MKNDIYQLGKMKNNKIKLIKPILIHIPRKSP